MTRKEYSGWTNYETWNIALWIDNDYGLQSMFNEDAQRCYDEEDKGEDRERNASNKLADILSDWFDQEVSEKDIPNGWMADAINTFLSEVDWYEIAEHYISDVEKEDIETEELTP